MLAAGSLIVGQSFNAAAQAVEVRQWQGTNAQTRQSEHVVATNNAEWRGLWSRVGAAPPDHFEPGRMRAVGIFLGRRHGEGYLVNILSANRRRDRIVIVFEERVPAEALMAQRSSMAASRPVASSPSFAPGGAAGFAPSANATASLAPAPARPPAVVTSPWAIVLINRSDLPVSVEQRLLR